MSYYDYPEFEYDKDLDINVDTNINFDTSVTLDVYKDVVVYTDVYTNVEGNSAFLVADVEADGRRLNEVKKPSKLPAASDFKKPEI